MIRRIRPLTACAVALAVLTAGCERSKSANPLSPDVAGPLPGVQISAPQLLEPGNGATLVGQRADVQMVIGNPETSGPRPLWMRLDVATDPAFTQMLHQADRVVPGTDGRTVYRIPAQLAAGKTYYWRARAADGANEGPYSAVGTFSVVEPVVIEPPAVIGPVGQIATNRPDFQVRNGTVSGPAGEVIYRFEVGTAPDPAAIAAVVTVPASPGGVTSMSLGDLPYGRTLFWRVYATDGTVNSGYSGLAQFRTMDAPAPPPPAPGPGPAPPPSPNPTPTPPSSQPRSISPEEALSIIRNVHDAEGWNLGSRSSREQRVEFLYRAVAAVHYGSARFNPRGPDPNWCVKDAGGGRPPSDDVLVRCSSREAWDLIGSAGADGYRFHLDFIGRLGNEQNVYPPPRNAAP